MKRLLPGIGLLALAAIFVGCNSPADEVTGVDQAIELAAKGGVPGPPDGGSGGDEGLVFDLTLTGALVEAKQVVPSRDNKNTLHISDILGTWNMTNTHAAALVELSDPAAESVCEFRPATMPHALKAEAVAALLGPKAGGGLRVNKRDGRGAISGNGDRPEGTYWTSWGFNTQVDALPGEDDPGPAYVDDNGSGVDWNDATAAREFRFYGGYYRVVIPDEGDMVCQVQDEMVAVLAPAS